MIKNLFVLMLLITGLLSAQGTVHPRQLRQAGATSGQPIVWGGSVYGPGVASMAGGGTGRSSACATNEIIIQASSTAYGCLDAGDLASAISTPEQHGAIGDGTTDDTVAVQAAITAACDGGTTAKTVWLSNIYKITSSINITAGNCYIGGGGTIKPVATSGTIYALNIQGSTSATTGTNTTISLATARQTATLSFDFDSVSGMAVGSYVSIDFSNGTQIYTQVSRIAAISGTTVTLDDALLIPIVATEANTVVERLMVEKVHVSDLVFDGSGCTSSATCYGIKNDNVANNTYRNLRFSTFQNNGAIAFYVSSAAYNISVTDITIDDCGDNAGGQTSDMWIIHASNSTFTNIFSTNAVGFGPQCGQCTKVSWSNVRAIRPYSRALKFNGLVYSDLVNLEGTGSLTATGIAITNGSYHNNLINSAAHRNAVAQGLWFSDQDNDYNNVVNFRGYDNGDTPVALFATDNNNRIFNVQGDDDGASGVVVYDIGGNNVGSAGDTNVNRANYTLVNGDNDDFTYTRQFVRIEGPSTDFAITGLQPAVDGNVVHLVNMSTENMTIKFDDSGSTEIYRIYTPTNADIATVGDGSVTLIYDAQSERWRVIAFTE